MFIPQKLVMRNIMAYDLFEYDFKQGAKIIVGENKDDPGQGGNGAGKSGIAEGLSLAATGSTIRKIKTKEIVRRGCGSGEVEWYLYNAMYRCEIKIWRCIHATKSAEYAMWIDGEEMRDQYSDFNTFNDYVFKILGISKEDFFNFYLMTLTDYKPFLNTGDTEKKKIINRFSGAHKVDNALPFIEDEMKTWDNKIRAIDREIANVKGKQEVIGDQIKAEEAKYSEEGKKKQLEELCATELQFEERIKAVQQDLSEGNELLAEGKSILAKIVDKDFSEEKEQYRSAIKDALDDCEVLAIDQRGIRKRLKEAVQIKAEMVNGLAGLITCPECAHKFTLQDKDFNIEEAEEVIRQLTNDIIPGIEKELIESGTQIEQYTEAIDAAKVSLKELERKEEAMAKEIKGHKKNIETVEDSIVKQERLLKGYRQDIEQVRIKKDAIKSGKSETVVNLNTQLLDYIDEETDLRTKLQEAMEEKAALEKWLVNFKNFKSYLANKSIKNIQDYTNMYLQSMGTNISIKIDGYRVLANKKMKEEITTEVLRDGFSIGSYGCFSAGERGRIDVACILAIQSLINLNSTTGGLDLCNCDEILDSVDSLGLELLVRSLQNVGRTIMIVSQQDINALSEHTLVIRKENGTSKIV